MSFFFFWQVGYWGGGAGAGSTSPLHLIRVVCLSVDGGYGQQLATEENEFLPLSAIDLSIAPLRNGSYKPQLSP